MERLGTVHTVPQPLPPAWDFLERVIFVLLIFLWILEIVLFSSDWFPSSPTPYHVDSLSCQVIYIYIYIYIYTYLHDSYDITIVHTIKFSDYKALYCVQYCINQQCCGAEAVCLGSGFPSSFVSGTRLRIPPQIRLQLVAVNTAVVIETLNAFL